MHKEQGYDLEYFWLALFSKFISESKISELGKCFCSYM